MSLQLVTGGSGVGKSHILYEELIRESLAHPDRNYFVLVPEQFTMQTQDDLARRSPRKGLLNVDVLSFNRLAHRVFGEVGGNTRPVLDDMGKSLVVQKVIAKKKDELGTLRRALAKRGAAEQMKSLISELLQYRVEPQDLDAWIREFSDRVLLAGKLADIRTVYRGFCDYLSDKYLTTEELLQVLAGVIARSSVLAGSVVLMDGFTGFTPVQYEVIRELLTVCADVTVVLTADEDTDLAREDGGHRLFSMSCQSAVRLTRIARELHVDIAPLRRVSAGEKSRHADSPELAHLEQHLFRNDHAEYEGESGNSLFISEAADPAGEVLAAAEVIRRRVREEGLRYSDFALVTGDLETYGRLAGQIFTEAGIPHFLDSKKPVWSNAMVELIRAALELLTRRHSYASVLRYLRCSFSGFSADEVDRLDNYVLALGVRGRSQYGQRWIRPSRRMETAELELLNELRERFVEQTEDFISGMRSADTVAKKTKVLYDLLLKTELQKKCRDAEDAAAAEGDAGVAREYAQIYPRVIDLLDKLVEVLGDERVTMADYQQLLETGFAELRLGLVPPGEDQVQIGDIERSRLSRVKVLFLTGVNEGIIPRPVTDAGLLSEPDRLLLAGGNIELAPTAREEIARQRFYLYLCMTKASRALYLSFAVTDASGTATPPSYLIGAVRRLFPNLSVRSLVKERSVLDLLETPQGKEQILLAGARNRRDQEGAFAELGRAMQEDEAGRETLARLYSAAAIRNKNKGLGRELTRALYGDLIRNSATRLERFAACPFAHFASYGLRLAEREIYDFSGADMGNILHGALELFSKKITEKKLDWAALNEETRDALADESLDEIAYGYGNAILGSSNRRLFTIERIRRMLRRTVWVLQEQLRHGSFVAGSFEESFGGKGGGPSAEVALPDGMRMQLIGRIDRCDICEQDGKRFVKVIDYKTGKTKLDLGLLLEGLQIQLALYLNAAVERERREHPGAVVEPAGMFYYHVDDPILKEVAAGQEEDALLKELRPDGLVRSEEEILLLFDKELEPGTASSVIPVKRKKDGTPDAYSRVADRDLFALVADFVETKARELAGRIAGGEIAVAPYRGKGRTACAWCPYREVCAFDLRVPGCGFRLLRDEKQEDIIAKMEQQVSQGDRKKEMTDGEATE